MARNGKDLFVLLAERHKERSRRSAGESGAAAVGETVGRLVKSAVKTLRGEEGGEPKPKRSRAPARRSPARAVPKGLLIPGWILAAMLVLTLGAGFAVGRFTSAAGGGAAISAKESHGAARPSVFREPRAGDLTPEEEVRELHSFFYPVEAYGPDGREVAAELARKLRAGGIATARIRKFLWQKGPKRGSIRAWVTLCYAASPADKDTNSAILAELRRLSGPLGFEVDPKLRTL